MPKSFCLGFLLATICGMSAYGKEPAIDTLSDPNKKSAPQRMQSKLENAPNFELPKSVAAYSMNLETKGCIGDNKAYLVIDKNGIAKLNFQNCAIPNLDKKSAALALGEAKGPEKDKEISFWTHHFLTLHPSGPNIYHLDVEYADGEGHWKRYRLRGYQISNSNWQTVGAEKE